MLIKEIYTAEEEAELRQTRLIETINNLDFVMSPAKEAETRQRWADEAAAEAIARPIREIKNQLAELDAKLPRAVEDILQATGADMEKLPAEMRQTIQLKQEARERLEALLSVQE